MRFYETMFIVRPMTSEEEVKRRIDFFKDVILKNEGEIETCLDMGMRNMAYPINKHQRGYYFVVYFRANPGMISELERLYRINEDILRFIVIKYESKKEIKQWHTLVDRANKKPGSYTGFRKDKDETRTHESRNQAGKMKVEGKEDSQKGGVEAS